METPEDLKTRVKYLERELDAASKAFATMQKAIAILSRHVLRHAAALQVIGPLVEDLAGGTSFSDSDVSKPLRASEEIAELKKMFESSN